MNNPTSGPFNDGPSVTIAQVTTTNPFHFKGRPTYPYQPIHSLNALAKFWGKKSASKKIFTIKIHFISSNKFEYGDVNQEGKIYKKN